MTSARTRRHDAGGHCGQLFLLPRLADSPKGYVRFMWGSRSSPPTAHAVTSIAIPAQAEAQSTEQKVPMMNRSAAPFGRRSSE